MANEDKSARYHRLRRRASVLSAALGALFLFVLLVSGWSASLRDASASLARGTNMMFDHMSVTWGVDETFSLNWDGKGNSLDNITIQILPPQITLGLAAHVVQRRRKAFRRLAHLRREVVTAVGIDELERVPLARVAQSLTILAAVFGSR